MIFHSLDFAVFFIITCGIYWMLPHRAQNLFLVAAGSLFYGYVHPWFLLPLVFSASVDYFAAIQMERRPAYKRAFLLASLISNLGLLGFFKYFNFFIANVDAAASALGLQFSRPALQIILQVGI